jgi:hypothetical protein
MLDASAHTKTQKRLSQSVRCVRSKRTGSREHRIDL